MSDATVYEFVLEAMNEVLDKQRIIDFVRDLFWHQTNLHYEDVIRQMIGKLMNIKVCNVKDGEIVKVLVDLDVKKKRRVSVHEVDGHGRSNMDA